MTNDEAIEVIAMLATGFPGAIPVETAKVWAVVIKDDDRALAREAAIEVMRLYDRVTLKAYHTEYAKLRARDRHEASVVTADRQITAGRSADRREVIARQVAIDMVLGRLPDGTQYADELVRRIGEEG